MQFLALVCDYDGTLAKDGRVSQQTIAALERVVASGRKLLLVTGRILEDLQRAFPRLDLFAYVVAENGAVLYHPASSTEKMLGEVPPERFIEALHTRGVVPLATGRVIVSTWHPHETTVLEVIRELGLERQVIFNKGAVMVLPTGVNKGTGMAAALHELMLTSGFRHVRVVPRYKQRSSRDILCPPREVVLPFKERDYIRKWRAKQVLSRMPHQDTCFGCDTFSIPSTCIEKVNAIKS